MWPTETEVHARRLIALLRTYAGIGNESCLSRFQWDNFRMNALTNSLVIRNVFLVRDRVETKEGKRRYHDRTNLRIASVNGRAHWVDVRKGPVAGEMFPSKVEISAGQEVVKRASDEIREGTPLTNRYATQPNSESALKLNR